MSFVRWNGKKDFESDKMNKRACRSEMAKRVKASA
jgi:hypothetical protein